MADAISIQELIDARTDAKTLEEAVNGDAVTTVLSRLGETYPTLSNALNQIDSKLDSADAQIKQAITDLFQNGGLPATPFATKALMTASALVDGKYAMVTDDTVNNGLYIKTAGTWVKSEYNITSALKDELISINGIYTNLASAERVVRINKKIVIISTDTVSSISGMRLEVVPVEKGDVYTIYTPNENTSAWGIWDSDSINPTGTLTAYYGRTTPAGSNPNCEVLGGGLFQITIPETSGGFICFNTIVPSQKYNVSGEVIVVKGAYDFVPRNTIDTLFGLEVKDSFARKELSNITGDTQINSPLSGKTWVAIGDSITEKNFRANRNYHDFVKDKVPDLTVYNLGVSGTGFFNRPNVADEITVSNPDIITVFFGTNDYGSSNSLKPLGDFLDTGTDTISGYINTCITGLMTKFPAAKFAMITPLPRGTSYGLNGANNNQGYSLYELSQLIIKYASHYSLPCLDLYTKSNLPVWTDAGNQLFFKTPSSQTGDRLHPNDLGQQRMAEIIKPFLESF